MIDRAAGYIIAAALLAAAAVTLASCGAAEGADPREIGEGPAIADHTDQKEISSGDLSIDEIIRRGELLFEASFNTLDGAGRPETADVERRNNVSIGNPRPRHDFPDNFNRISAPDANTCVECHTTPRAGGGAGNAANVFVLADRLPFATFNGGPGDNNETHTLMSIGNERGSLGLFGSGWIELLAREMTVDLKAAAEKAIEKARRTGQDVTVDLETKGVSFGRITAHRDATLDFSELEGVDNDLVIRPFQQKGVVVSLREFGVKAMIYIADGPSDVPVFSILNQHGGRTLGVYTLDPRNNHKQVKQLQEQGRIQGMAEADYRAGKAANLWLMDSLEQIARGIVEDRRKAFAEIPNPPGHA